MKFVKMQGCGNDYIYFDCMDGVPEELNDENIKAVAIRLSDRHFGIGGDGVVLICKSKTCSAKMRMFNADGSEGAMCGNATRCIGKYLYDFGYVKGENATLETKSGVKTLKLHLQNGICVGATVFMGQAAPLDLGDLVKANGRTYAFVGVDIGNPHAVIFTDKKLTDELVKGVGPLIEKHSLFPDGVNVEFVRNLGDNVLEMRVWERGSGETLACGTGSCATAYAAVVTGICAIDRPITVKLLGGELTIDVKREGIYMAGPAKIAFTGDVKL